MQVAHAIINHEGRTARLKVSGIFRKRAPNGRAGFFGSRRFTPLKNDATAAVGFETQMLFVPRLQFLRIGGFEKDPADASHTFCRRTFHNVTAAMFVAPALAGPRCRLKAGLPTEAGSYKFRVSS